jgi:hypothetical protein
MKLNLKDSWQQGVALSDADFHFAPAKLRSEFIASRDVSPSSPDTFGPPSVDADPAELFRRAGKHFLDFIESVRPKLAIRDEMRARLLEKILAGKFIVIGFPVKNGILDTDLSELPLGLINTRFIKWADSSMTGLGRHFVSVKVSRVARIEHGLEPKHTVAPQATERLKPGPKSQAPFIDEAIRALVRNSVNLDAKAEKEAGDLVREQISSQTGKQIAGLRGFSDETIRRRIVKHYKAVG